MISGQQNNIGVVGVTPKANLLLLKVIDKTTRLVYVHHLACLSLKANVTTCTPGLATSERASFLFGWDTYDLSSALQKPSVYRINKIWSIEFYH